ncbi:hypothetical protein SNEBB_006957, partial [Seison nebaliae]
TTYLEELLDTWEIRELGSGLMANGKKNSGESEALDA